ncbi:TonB-dependent receptor [Carboxylicivirga linearis]|uniref:TonB-dependent receptor n=1 Tax=Carboxylicivirga linearis TaxID=1628157 RepID=A0ABS5JTQ9_9BACT|nr:TonB-dependent receptor [Carboxylicivirga linearis]MBS2098286.1 TonB-dependent receptor [Carboxylicivirga linearis]
MKKGLVLIAVLTFIMNGIWGQELSQSIKGRVLDADTHQPLPGVNVILIGSTPPIGTVTDFNGNYELPDIPLGRQRVQFSFMGYDPTIFNELEIRSGRAFVLNVNMKESFQQLNEVTVKPEFRKDKAQNNMAALSARSFSVEEASRYAGGWNDPARLASSFAGVTMSEGVNDNAIVIRGNAPKGILWKLEDVEIPAPNHLNGVNNGGGIETVFSVNMLDNSDFYTGAFPAEYGNAMSGVFDMKFRNGSNEKLQSTFQVGSQGIDISAEGPFKKDGDATFLFNYRYSTMGLIGEFVDGNFGMPNYQDLSFKVHLPIQQAGDFSIWGIGGISSVAFDPDEDVNTWTNTFDNNQYSTGSDIAATGISHQINTGSKTYLKSSVALSYDKFSMESNQWQRDGSIIPMANHNEDNTRLLLSSYINHKFGNRHTNRTGVRYTNTHYSIMVNGNPDPTEGSDLIHIADQSGNIGQAQFFTQSKWRIASTFDVIGGITASYFDMNDEIIVEPRISTVWRFRPQHSISLAYGKHSRPELLRFYEATNNDGHLLNPDLKVTKTNHYVLGYEYRINSNLKLKIEGYYQQLYDVPVIEGSSYSLLNYQWDDYFEEALVNDGTGTNIGVDITLERYMKQGYYYMITASIFDSKYKGGDGVERNTSFNRNYVFNLLGGKEWRVRENNSFGVNTKIAFMGGNRFTPADQEASQQNEMVILDENRAFEWQEDPKLFVDLSVNYKINRQKTAHVLTLQAKNLLMQKEMFGWAYDFGQQKVVEHGLAMAYPYFTYRIEF